MTFEVKAYPLPHDGIIPGARGHKKIVIPRGTQIYCITYQDRKFWCGYLKEDSAKEVANNLENSLNPDARRHIPLETLVAWNFKSKIPLRIHREKALT
jgi:hypothetical protein